MKFSKWQGCGNDFVLINCLQDKVADYAAFAQEVCDRHYGVGADGILVVEPSVKADFRMRIFNTDGSEAEMCGNGIRCFARYLYDSHLTDKKEFTVETGAGVLVPRLIFEGDTVSGVRVDMGEPILEGDEIPVKGFGRRHVVNEKLTVTRNAFGGEHDAQVLFTGENGRDTWYTLEPLEADAYGFVGAVPMGSFRARI